MSMGASTRGARPGKVARIWSNDDTEWTGSGEGAWLGWLGVALDQAAHDHRFQALTEQVREAGFAHAVVLGMGGVEPVPGRTGAQLCRPQGSASASRA